MCADLRTNPRDRSDPDWTRMALPKQATSLLLAARQLAAALPADAVLLLPDTDLDWGEVCDQLGDSTVLVAARDPAVVGSARRCPRVTVVDIDPGPTPMQ